MGLGGHCHRQPGGGGDRFRPRDEPRLKRAEYNSLNEAVNSFLDISDVALGICAMRGIRVSFLEHFREFRVFSDFLLWKLSTSILYGKFPETRPNVERIRLKEGEITSSSSFFHRERCTRGIVRAQGEMRPSRSTTKHAARLRREPAHIKHLARTSEERRLRSAQILAARKKKESTLTPEELEIKKRGARAANAASRAKKREREAVATLQQLANAGSQASASTPSPTEGGKGGVVGRSGGGGRKIPKEFEKLVRVEEGIRVKSEWVRAVDDFMASALNVKRARPVDKVEGRRGRWGQLVVKGVAQSGADRPELKELIDVLGAIVTKNNDVTGMKKRRGVKATPHSVFVRPYTGGPTSVEELPRAHVDSLDDEAGGPNDSPCCSIVLVLEGGVSISGIDVELVTSKKRAYPQRLEAGDALLLGPDVPHQVIFSPMTSSSTRDDTPLAVWRNPCREQGWGRRVTIVAFFE